MAGGTSQMEKYLKLCIELIVVAQNNNKKRRVFSSPLC